MLENIGNVIVTYTNEVHNIFDGFSGSGVVSYYFKNAGYNVISNDIMYFSYILTRGINSLNGNPTFDGLNNIGIENPINYLNNLHLQDTNIRIEDCFIYQNYSPNDNCERMFFQNDNAMKIDIIRQTIENWHIENLITEDEYFYLLAVLINAVPYVANITGVYAAYLKNWDIRTYNELRLSHIEIIANNTICQSFNEDVNIAANNLHSDLTYLDPPYNGRQYLPNYHILETIARYDNPIINGKTGVRDYCNQKSTYCRKHDVYNSLNNLIDNLNTRYVLLSYNNEGLLSQEEITTILMDHGIRNSFRYFEYDFRRYKSKIPNNKDGLKEQLYFIEKQ